MTLLRGLAVRRDQTWHSVDKDNIQLTGTPWLRTTMTVSVKTGY